MPKTLYVGNLQWGTTEDELADHFASCGTVHSAKIVLDKETGRSRGFGFVEMEKADEAIAALHGKELKGRTLTVNVARERESRGSFKPSASSHRNEDTF